MELALGLEQRARERARDLALADARRPVEEVRVRRPLAQRGVEQPRRPRRAQRSARTCSRISSAISSGERAPSSATMRSAPRGERAVRLVDAAHEARALALDPVAAVAAPRRRASSGSSSTRNVRSGSSPPVTVRLRSRTCVLAERRARRPGRRPTSRGSGRRRRPPRARAPAGSRARRARRARPRRAPPRPTASCRAPWSTSSRTASPTGVPPGSRVASTARPCSRSHSASSSACVLFPDQSTPSKVTNIAA